MDDETKPKQPWTPGKWEVFGGYLLRSHGDSLAAVALADLVTPYRPGIGLVRGEDELHANGVLMAAAPVMAEALALFVRTLEAGRDQKTNPLRLALDRDRCERDARAALDLCGWRWS